MVMDMAMVTMDIMARDLPMLSLLLLLSLDTDMVVTDTMDIMARGLLMLSQAMDIMVMDMVMDMAMDMDMVIMDIMARDLLSQDMDIMAMDMVMDIMDMVMAMVMDTTAKHFCC